MKKSALMIAMAFGVTSAFAQLSTRENDETVIKYGARPKAGDMAFVLGTSLANDSGMTAKLFSGNALQSGNILTYKYYKSDDIVIRAGIRFMNKNLTVKGTGADSSAVYAPSTANNGSALYDNFTDVKDKTVERMYEIVPGIEKHFVAANIFDAYVGADLYLGFGSDKSIKNYTYANGDKNFTNRKTNTTNVGLGVITGFNVFLGHLPMSIGLEYGWNAKWTFGGVTKVKQDVTAGTTSYSVKYKEEQSSNAVGATSAKYSKLSRREFNANTNQDVRIVLHIYFAR